MILCKYLHENLFPVLGEVLAVHAVLAVSARPEVEARRARETFLKFERSFRNSPGVMEHCAGQLPPALAGGLVEGEVVGEAVQGEADQRLLGLVLGHGLTKPRQVPASRRLTSHTRGLNPLPRILFLENNSKFRLD